MPIINDDEVGNSIEGDQTPGDFNDTINGNGGEDTIDGNSGADFLNGGAEDDQFIYDQATDFSAGETIDGGADGDFGDLLWLAGGPYTFDFTTAVISGIEDMIFSDSILPSGTPTGAKKAIFTAGFAAELTRIDFNSANSTIEFRMGTVNTLDLSTVLIAGNATGLPSASLRIIGDNSNETITGSVANQFTFVAINDYINTAGGNDRVFIGDGADHIILGNGNDTVVLEDFVSDGITGTWEGGGGRDTIEVKRTSTLTDVEMSGFERVRFTALGPQTVTMRADQISTDAEIIGGQAFDRVILQLNAATANSDFSGFTFTNFDEGILQIEATAGFNGAINLIGSSRGDIIRTGGGNDTIRGGLGGDDIDTGAGNDLFLLTQADIAAGERIDGGAGSDRIRISSSLDFRALPAGSINDIEMLEFTGASAKTVSLIANVLVTANGVKIKGSGGTDALDFTLGALTPFLDLSQFTFQSWSAADKITVTGGAAVETVIGSSQADRIVMNGGNDTVAGGAGNDTLNGGGGSDTLIAATGNNDLKSASFLSIEKIGFIDDTSVVPGATLTLAATQFGAGKIAAGASVNGSAANERLEIAMGAATTFSLANLTFANWSAADRVAVTGDAHAETITGSSQIDEIRGKGGGDTLSGKGGGDIFIFGPGSGADIILDFADTGGGADDTIDVRAYNFTNTGQIGKSAVGNDLVLNFGGGNTLTITGYMTSHNINQINDDLVI